MPQTDFNTDDPLALACALSDVLIDTITETQEFGGAAVAERLRKLRDKVWSPRPVADSGKDTLFRETLEGLDEKQKTNLFEAYARMGHLYDLAALAAREHYFDRLRQRGTPIPGGIAEFAAKQNDASVAVEALNKPVFEVVMTMHPTNTNSLESMAAQRKIAQALAAHEPDKIKEAIAEFRRVPLLNQKDGHDANFTVRDETNIVLHSLGNIYEDLPKLYEKFDQELEKKTGYNSAALNLNIRFGSWGSAGDKDGNNSVTAETALEAIAMHTQAIVSRYDGFLKKHTSLTQQEPLKGWQEKLSQALAQLDPLVQKIGALREDSDRIRKEGNAPPDAGAQLNARFDALSHDLSELRKTLKASAFIQDIERAHADSACPDKQGALDLLRRARVFGFNFSKIEYRETAEEYTRAVGALVPGYEGLPPPGRALKLTELLGQGNAPVEHYERLREKIIGQGGVKKYAKDDALPIAYHTMKRMELARDFPDMITDNVLAECGKLRKKNPAPEEVKQQGVSNMLEAVFLQRAAEKDGRKPMLGVVPLFEEPETMQNIDGILKEAYHNPAYAKHQDALAQGGKKTQQVQIAHSDNARRAGLQAARAFIHEAHKKVRALNEQEGIQTQFFEGGSISDAYRNGVRAISASVNAFNMHDFAKFTFQGGDLLNYFNVPASIERVFTRNIVHSAERLQHGGNGNSEHDNPVLDEIAIAALKDTLQDYQKKDFTPNTMGILLAALDYERESKIGACGSRAGERGLAFAKVDSARVGATIKPVAIDEVRTISFSKAWQHAGIVPSWIGSQKLEDHLKDEIIQRLDQLSGSPDLATAFSTVKQHGLNAEHLQLLYKYSPAFRDAQDRAAYALAMTDPKAFTAVEKTLEAWQPGEDRNRAESYLRHIRDAYWKTSRTAYAALAGKDLPESRIVQNAMAGKLDRLTGVITQKCNYRSFLLHARELGGWDDHARRILHNAGDTVMHGRMPPADDPAYGRFRTEEKSQVASAARN